MMLLSADRGKKKDERKERMRVMKYAEWVEEVMSEIKNDPIWKLDVYRRRFSQMILAGMMFWYYPKKN